jgi:hypothetical protein
MTFRFLYSTCGNGLAGEGRVGRLGRLGRAAARVARSGSGGRSARMRFWTQWVLEVWAWEEKGPGR